jgi:rhodanese-related sulfurtransferase
MKTAEGYLAEANAVVPKIAVEDAIARHATGEALFIDVRDGKDIAESGTVAGALHIPRGFVEFAADDATPFHNAALSKDAEIILVCAAGGMAALTGKTLIDMGYKNVSNGGGFPAWKEAGGATE